MCYLQKAFVMHSFKWNAAITYLLASALQKSVVRSHHLYMVESGYKYYFIDLLPTTSTKTMSDDIECRNKIKIWCLT